MVTVGGGIVLDSTPTLRVTKLEETLATFAEGKLERSLALRIQRRGQRGIAMQRLVAESGLDEAQIESALTVPLHEREILRVGDLRIDSNELQKLIDLVRVTVSDFHTKNPLEPGIPKERLREHVNSVPTIFEHVLQVMTGEKNIEVAGEIVRLPGRGVVMKDEEAESKLKIETAFSTAGLKVPALPEVLAGLKIDKNRAQKIVTLLLRDKVLIKVSNDLVFHRSALDSLRQQIAAQKAKSQAIDVALFKEMTGVSRKYAIPLLEYLDRERVTKRVGDSRVIL